MQWVDGWLVWKDKDGQTLDAVCRKQLEKDVTLQMKYDNEKIYNSRTATDARVRRPH